MNIEYFRQFLTLADTLSYSTAAERLFISQSSLSRHIAQLEQEFDAVFFVRNTRNVELTPIGKQAVASFQEIVLRHQELAALIQNDKIKTKGTITIGFMYHCSRCFNEICSHFKDKYPDVNMIIKSSKPEILYELLRTGQIDVVQMMDTSLPGFGNCRFQCFQECPHMVMMREDNPLAARQSLNLSDLTDQININLGENDFLKKFLLAHGLHCQSEIATDNMDIIAMKIKETGGIYITAECFQFLKMPGVTSRPLQQADLVYPMYVGYRSSNPNPLIGYFMREVSLFAHKKA